MRIGIFSESYEPVLNGVAVSVATLSRELKSLGHRVYVFAPAYPGYHEADRDVFRFPSVRTLVAPDYPLAFPYMSGLRSRVEALKLDVIHTHTPFMLGLLGLGLGRRLGIPVVSTNHTQYAEYVHYFPLAPRRVSRAFVIGLMRRYYSACDSIVVPSKAMAEMLRSHGVSVPIHVVATGNSLDVTRDPAFRETIRREYNLPLDAMVLIYVGRLAREKNLSLLLDAFNRLSAIHQELRLILVGGGPYRAWLKRRVKQRGLADKVVFTGLVPRERVGQMYCVGDIFVFPSTTESQGLVLCEALKAGLPCVAVRAGGSPEMLREGEDSLLTEDDVDDFTAKIQRLLEDKALREHLSAGAIENSSRFCTNDMAVRMIDVYESVCRRQP